MTKQVEWTKFIVETFIEEGMLSEEEAKVMRTRAQGWTRTKQAREFGMSMSTLDRIIKRLKIKYDAVQLNNPKLPKRKHSDLEDYMDAN